MRSTFLLLFLLCFPAILHAEAPADSDSIQELQNIAKIKKLARTRQWQSLLHYVPYRPISEVKSTVDDSKFFLADHGKYDAEAELSETIRSFFRAEKEGELHPQCQFPARYFWLKKMLAFDTEKLHEVSCADFEEWKEGLGASGVTLIFPTSFINNPASAFGHTLIRLDQKETIEKAPLLSYAVNYSAATSGEDALTYAFLGVTGGYQGFYNVAPYYQLVTRYSDIESRDIWEYKLDFTQDEVDRLIRHLWELRSISSDYYYFDENCSYHLLALLDAARPELNLLPDASVWVIPIDTVKSLGSVQSTSPVFRPSKAAVLKARTAASTPGSRALARELIKRMDESPATVTQGVSEQEKASALDLAYDYLSYKERYRSEETKALDERMFELLKERSTVQVVSPAVTAVSPEPPETGHGTFRVSTGAGRASGKWRSALEFRPAYHNLLDPPRGYTPGSQIEFFSLGASVEEQGQISLDTFKFIDVISLNTSTPFTSPISWALDVSADRARTRSDDESFLPHLNLGFGKAFELGAEHNYIYFLADLNVELHGSYDHNTSAGNGGTAGMIYQLTESLALQTELRGGRMYIGEDQTYYSLRLAPRLTLTDSSALRFELTRDFRFHDQRNAGMLYVDIFG